MSTDTKTEEDKTAANSEKENKSADKKKASKTMEGNKKDTEAYIKGCSLLIKRVKESEYKSDYRNAAMIKLESAVGFLTQELGDINKVLEVAETIT